MDQELISRFRSGDPNARTAMRNHLRAVAARVLASPRWRFDAPTRTELEKEAAAIALGSLAPDAVGYAVAAMDAAALKGLERLRKDDGVVGRHPEAQLIVSVALETASENQARQLEQHASQCTRCSTHIELVRLALRTAASANRAAEVPAPKPAPPAAPPANRPRPKRGLRRRQEQKKPIAVPWTPVVIAGLIIAAGSWWAGRLSPEQESWKAAALLPDELPPDAMASLYAGSTAAAIEGLGQGDCRAASTKLHMAWRGDPEDWNLRYLEGLAYVCSHDGPNAFEALRDVNDNVQYDELPWGFDWWYAQALVLDLQIGDALWELERISESDHPRGKDAANLASRVRAAY